MYASLLLDGLGKGANKSFSHTKNSAYRKSSIGRQKWQKKSIIACKMCCLQHTCRPKSVKMFLFLSFKSVNSHLNKCIMYKFQLMQLNIVFILNIPKKDQQPKNKYTYWQNIQGKNMKIMQMLNSKVKFSCVNWTYALLLLNLRNLFSCCLNQIWIVNIF